ncbi:IS110 family transposase [Pseudophaeobacter sp. 1A16562]|uniref:IS110 family transposase n=1 Tax=Pseudophaeobacter sp. 1A16562 TaxID=3098143 RepID=UPI0034D605B2
MKEEQPTIHVGIDVSKDKLAVAIASGGVRDEVLSLGTFENAPASVNRLLKKLSGRGAPVSVCYEAGPTGYGLCRQVRAFGFECCVVAPSLIPVRAGERVKTDRLDAIRLARLLRAGELTPIWVPDETHEAMRDLVRARESAAEDQRHKRQLVSAFMLRHGRIYHRTKPWTMRYRQWLQSQSFDHQAHQIALQEMLQAERNASERLDRLTGHIEALVPEWDLAPAVNALQALRGVALISAVTFMAEIGDVRRFETPVKLMAYLGLVPSEHSTGKTTKRGGITRAGNSRVRHKLVEGAWTYRLPARPGARKLYILQEQSAEVQDIAWKAQSRLTARYRKLSQRGKKSTVVTTAIAREMAAFMWDIARRTMPAC